MKYRHFVTGENLRQGVFLFSRELRNSPWSYIRVQLKQTKSLLFNVSSCGKREKHNGEEVIRLTKPKKTRNGPKLDKYIRYGKQRRYATYAKAAVYYSIPYYGMVRIAKEANACWKIRKTVIVDLDKLESYLEKNCRGSEEDKSYLLTALFNAGSTMSSYYKAMVNHDMPQFAG